MLRIDKYHVSKLMLYFKDLYLNPYLEGILDYNFEKNMILVDFKVFSLFLVLFKGFRGLRRVT